MPEVARYVRGATVGGRQAKNFTVNSATGNDSRSDRAAASSSEISRGQLLAGLWAKFSSKEKAEVAAAQITSRRPSAQGSTIFFLSGIVFSYL